jgi:hypothetical protein
MKTKILIILGGVVPDDGIPAVIGSIGGGTFDHRYLAGVSVDRSDRYLDRRQFRNSARDRQFRFGGCNDVALEQQEH